MKKLMTDGILKVYLKRVKIVGSIENVQELEGTGVEPLKLTNSNWGDVPNASSVEDKLDYIHGPFRNEHFGVISQFTFKVDDSVDKDLPTLKFTFKSAVSEDINVTINLLLEETESVDFEDYQYFMKSKLGENEKCVVYDRNYQERTLKVDSNASFMVLLRGLHSRDSFVSTKMGPASRWYFDDEKSKEFINNKSIELISSSIRYRSNQLPFDIDMDVEDEYFILDDYADAREIEYMFIFKVSEVNETIILPELNFSFMESEEGPAIKTQTIVLENMNEMVYTIFNFNDIQNTIRTKKVKLLNLKYLPIMTVCGS